MRYRLIIFIALLIAAVGCSHSDTPDAPSGNAITFGNTPDNWSGTRGMVYTQDNFDEMDIFAYYTAQKTWAEATTATDLSNFMYDQSVEKNAGSWEYTPIKYWPNNDNDKITFYALAPRNEVETTIDATSGKPLFHYIASPQSDQNFDLMADVVYDKEKDASGIEFEMKHALTRINISARTINAYAEGTDPDGYDVYYTVSAVLFSNIKMEGDMTLSESGEIAWSNLSNLSHITATQGYTLLDATIESSALPNDATPETLLDTDFKDVCKTDNAVFVLPQEIEGTTETLKPMVELRIHKHYTFTDQDGNVHYKDKLFVPEVVEIPTPDGEGWKRGEWLNMQFTFDVSADAETPLTVNSEVYDYIDVDLDMEVDKNIYIYADQEDMINIASGENTAQVRFFTNYSHNLTEIKTKYELDGTPTTSHGFVFYFDGATDYIIPTLVGENPDGSVKYKISRGAGYEFTYSVKKQKRSDLGLYDVTDSGNSSSTGIDITKDDAVYTLTIDIVDTHLDTNREFHGTVGVEMLSDAGGMITKLFPVKLKKDI